MDFYIDKAITYCEQYFNLHNQEHTYILFHSLQDILSYTSHTLTLLLLDIEMNEMINGIDLMHMIEHNIHIKYIVFMSSYTDYICNSFSPKTLGFCMKPINTEYLFSMLNTAINKSNSKPICFCNTPGAHIYEDNIIFISADGHYIDVTTTSTFSSSPLTFSIGIKSAQKLLEKTNIIRIHKSYMVNLLYVKLIQHNHVILTIDVNGTHELPLGRKYGATVMNAYSSFIINS